MRDDSPDSLTVVQRRRGRRLAYQNGAIWALGNGLTSSTLVIYLALELGAPGAGLAISMILAAPRIAGLLRMAAPSLIRWFGDRKRFCLAAYLLSVVVLAALPACIIARSLQTPYVGLIVLVMAWCLYHLLEYLGTVALWAWLGDLVPLRIRGRFLGRRERWMVSGQAIGMLVAALFTMFVRDAWPDLPKWLVYVLTAEVGVVCMALSLLPLTAMPDPRREKSCEPQMPAAQRSLFAPLTDKRFRRLIYFGCWFSFFNGVTQSVQYLYPARVLAISLGFMLLLKTGMRVGQLGISPTMGRLADRFGNRPVMLLTLPIVASGPLFYFFSTPDQWYWMIGAWVVWIAYAGLNVCLPNLMLKLAPGEEKEAYIASFYAISGLCIAGSTLLGGVLFDRYSDATFCVGRWEFDFYQYSFLFGWITRTMGVLVLWLIVERTTLNRSENLT
jgi:MFS family permease